MLRVCAGASLCVSLCVDEFRWVSLCVSLFVLFDVLWQVQVPNLRHKTPTFSPSIRPRCFHSSSHKMAHEGQELLDTFSIICGTRTFRKALRLWIGTSTICSLFPHLIVSGKCIITVMCVLLVSMSVSSPTRQLAVGVLHHLCGRCVVFGERFTHDCSYRSTTVCAVCDHLLHDAASSGHTHT